MSVIVIRHLPERQNLDDLSGQCGRMGSGNWQAGAGLGGFLEDHLRGGAQVAHRNHRFLKGFSPLAWGGRRWPAGGGLRSQPATLRLQAPGGVGGVEPQMCPVSSSRWVPGVGPPLLGAEGCPQALLTPPSPLSLPAAAAGCGAGHAGQHEGPEC